jgi:hypothetical protein
VAAKIAEEGNQSNENRETKKEGIEHIKARLGESLKEKQESKVMHGQYIESAYRQLSGEEDKFLWLLRGDLKGQTESEIMAAQTEYHVTKILHTETDSKCRPCQQFDKTTEHIISANPVLAKEEYVKRHDRVSAELHCNTRKEMGVKLNNKYRYDHVPISVETSPEGTITILWNQQCKLKINRTS